MNTQPPVHSKPLANGFGRRRGEREMGTRPEIKSLPGKPNFSSKVPNSGNRSVGYGSPSRGRLVYVSTCLIGHQVEVQVKSGAVYSGIFHSTNAEKDIGAVLKMARMIKGGKADVEPASKVPIKTLIIPAKDLVQVTAKDVSITRDGFSADAQNEKQAELMIDSYISQSRPGEMERELEPWIPDADDLQRPELENVFDSKWNRGWNQFEANAALFGVTSTFDEELYTTKLDRGPQMRERERVAQRIAREIEGEETHDLHLAEERGFQLGDKFDVDEETRYSSVSRGKIIDGYVESEDTLLDSCNDETFGDSSTSSIKSSSDWTKGKSNDVVRASSSSPTMDQAQSSQSSAALSISRSDSYDRTGHLASESPFKSSSTMTSERRRPENQLSEHGGINETNVYSEKKPSAEGTPMSNSDESSSALTGKKDGTDKEASHNAIFSASSRVPTKVNEKLNSSGEPVEDSAAGKPPHGRPGSSTSSRSEYMAPPSTSSGHGLSPTSSVASIASEKSSLNPYAKEFKLNANAKSYVPSHSPVRPPSPITDGSYYFQPNMPSVQQIPGMHVGMAAQFGQQPVVYNAQAAPPQAPPQAYFHPNGPQYAPQMFAHPRQVVYMPGYHQQPEAQYRGRDY